MRLPKKVRDFIAAKYAAGRDALTIKDRVLAEFDLTVALRQIESYVPNVKEWRREYKREYWQRPGVKERRREYRQRPDVKEKEREYKREYYVQVYKRLESLILDIFDKPTLTEREVVEKVEQKTGIRFRPSTIQNTILGLEERCGTDSPVLIKNTPEGITYLLNKNSPYLPSNTN